MAAMAVIEASTATWLRLAVVRNCGADKVTNPPRTSITRTRLSSRWRAMVPTMDPRGAPPAWTGATMGSAIGRLDRGVGGRLGPDLAGGGVHHPFLAGLGLGDLGREAALVQHE